MTDWPDLRGRINTENSSGTYYQNYSNAWIFNRVSSAAPGYKAVLEVMGSRSLVRVNMKFFAMAAPGTSATGAQIQAAKELLNDQVRALWNQRRLKIVVIVLDMWGRSTNVSRHFDVEFKIRFTETIATADYALCVYPKTIDLPKLPGRDDRPAHVTPAVAAQSGRIEIHIAATTVPWVYGHEFGHCIGLPDEYGAPGVRYFRPEGGEGVLLHRPGSLIPDNQQGRRTATGRDSDLRTEMSTHANSSLMPRHLWPTAIEVRKVMNQHARNTRSGIRYGADVDYPR